MPEKSFQRKAFMFLVTIGIITIVVLALSAIESIFQGYLVTQFGLSLDANGRLVSPDGGAPSMMTQ